MKIRTSVGLRSLLASSLLAASTAQAALGGASGIVIPYAGKLELNGALVTGSVDLQFGVLEDGTTDTACQTQTLTSVPVTNGEFAVTIPVEEVCVKGKDVHLQVAVKRDDGSFVVLGKQRVTPVVGAVTSGPGDFAVTGALTAGSANIAAGLQARGVIANELFSGSALLGTTTTNSLTVNGPLKTPGGFFGTLQKLQPPPAGGTFPIVNGGLGKIHTETAPADGMVMAVFYLSTSGAHLRAEGLVGAEVVQRFAVRNESGDTGSSLTFPVVRGSEWSVSWQDVSGLQVSVYFLPIGQ